MIGIREITGDLWKLYAHGHRIVITTNIGWSVPDKINNMGAGIALEAQFKYPALPQWYGRTCARLRSHTPVVVYPRDPQIIMFPVKPLLDPKNPERSWDQVASLELIERGLKQLLALDGPIALSTPGAGNGKLDPVTVAKLVRRVLNTDANPERFVLVEYEPDERYAPKWPREGLRAARERVGSAGRAEFILRNSSTRGRAYRQRVREIYSDMCGNELLGFAESNQRLLAAYKQADEEFAHLRESYPMLDAEHANLDALIPKRRNHPDRVSDVVSRVFSDLTVHARLFGFDRAVCGENDPLGMSLTSGPEVNCPKCIAAFTAEPHGPPVNTPQARCSTCGRALVHMGGRERFAVALCSACDADEYQRVVEAEAEELNERGSVSLEQLESPSAREAET